MKTIFKYGILAACFAVTNIASARTLYDTETYDFDVDGVAYNILSEENKTVEVTHGTRINTSHSQFVDFQYKGDVVVPPTVKYKDVTYDVVAVGASAFRPVETEQYPQPPVTSITLPNTIKTIGKSAFYDCVYITSLVIPEGVTEIEKQTFYNCKALSTLQINGNVTKIGESAFAGCECITALPNLSHLTKISDNAFEGCSIESVNIPGTVREIGYEAFAGCKYLKEVTIPNSVEVLQGFSDCPKLGYVYVPDSVKRIGEFNNCPNLKINGLPASLDSIYSNAFRNSGITSVIIPASVRYIGKRALTCCENLSAIDVDPNNTKYSSLDGVLFNKRRDKLMVYPGGCRKRYDYTIPASVTLVDESAFESNVGLTELRIPDTVKRLGRRAFYSVQNLCTIICGAAVPIGCSDSDSEMFNYPRIPYLFVPKGSVKAYKNAEKWRYYFDHISDNLPDYIGVVDIATDAVQNISVICRDGTIVVENAPDKAVIRVYNMQGMQVAETAEPEIRNLPAGIYVVAVGEETTKVMLNGEF